ncbi:MAG: TonB-dependent receptor [Bacteroidaceae bacterium]|nr:TonB-dependent receptor [Bacteroidaceae bacterium]
MRRFYGFLVFVCCSLSLCAQDEEKSVVLDAVTVKADMVVNKVDGQIIYPSEALKNASNNGYSIVQKLALPNIRVDNVAHTISAIDNRGDVQMRINGVVVGKEEMLALDTKLISKIEFIDNPGVRYGEEVAYVIDIRTRRASGYVLGADLTTALTSFDLDGTIYGKWNMGKSQFALSYNVNAGRFDQMQHDETAEYTLGDGSIYTIGRNDRETLKKGTAHNLKFTYNLADTTAYLFQVTLYKNFRNVPKDYRLLNITDGPQQYEATRSNSSSGGDQWIDLYFFRQLTPRQSITANAVGTYITTTNKNYYDEGAPYQYEVNGKTASVLSEVVYENRLKPFTLSAGLNHRYKYTKNDYIGDASALAEMNQHNLYVFGEIKGKLKDFRYVLGLGSSYIRYSQNKHNYDFWTFRPKVLLAYNLPHAMQLRYSFEMKDRVSRIAMINDVAIQTNRLEMTVGNPDLRPSRDIDQSLRLSYNDQRWNTYVEGFYRHCIKPNMAHYERTSDDKFIYTQINQKEIDLLRLSGYVSCWILPDKLQASVYGGMQRCFNYGNDYTHFYTSWFYVGSVTAYLGNFTLQGYIDNGNRFLEGEKRGYNGAYSTIQASYQYKDWQFTLAWSNPFVKNYKSMEDEILNRDLHKLTTVYDRASGNQVSLSVAWRMSRGKKYKSVDKTINLRDTDDGIMK